MEEIVCPTLEDQLASDQCQENFGGLPSIIYIGLRTDLAAKLVATENVFSTPTFMPGKGLYKIECKEAEQNVKGENNGTRKGFKQTYKWVLDEVTKKSSLFSRAVNNLPIFIIVPDEPNAMIMYNENHKITFDSGSISADTGTKSTDDRMTSYQATLDSCLYDVTYVTAPTKGWDSLLASAAAVGG